MYDSGRKWSGGLYLSNTCEFRQRRKKKKVDLIINITIIIIINNCKVEVDYFPVTARLQVFYSAYTTAIHQQLQLAKERQFLF